MDLLSLPQEGVDVLEFGIGRGDAKVVEDRIELPLHPGKSAVYMAELRSTAAEPSMAAPTRMTMPSQSIP